MTDNKGKAFKEGSRKVGQKEIPVVNLREIFKKNYGIVLTPGENEK